MSTFAHVILDQIGRGALMNLGARDYVRDDQRRQLMMRIGGGPTHRKAIVTLNGLDLYDVQIGRLKRRTCDWIPEADASNVYADQLADTLLTLHGKAVDR